MLFKIKFKNNLVKETNFTNMLGKFKFFNKPIIAIDVLPCEQLFFQNLENSWYNTLNLK